MARLRSIATFVFLLALTLTGAQDSRPRPPRRSSSTEHLDKLSRDELLDILDKIESSDPKKVGGSSKSPSPSYSTYPPVTAPPRSRFTTSRPSVPSYPSSRRPVPSSSEIDALINKYKNRQGQPGSPTVDDLLRRIRNNGPSAPSAPASRFNYPGPNYASNSPSRYPSAPSSYGSSSSSRGSSSSLPYPSSYNPSLFPTRAPVYPTLPSTYGSSYPSSYGTSARGSPSYRGNSPYGGPGYPTQGYSPVGSFGGAAPKYVTTTKKPKKGFLSKLFG